MLPVDQIFWLNFVLSEGRIKWSGDPKNNQSKNDQIWDHPCRQPVIFYG